MPSPPPALFPPPAHTPHIGIIASPIQPLPMPVSQLGMLPQQYPPVPPFHHGQLGAGGGQYDGTGQRMGTPLFYYGVPLPPPFYHYSDIAPWGHWYPPPQAPILHPSNVQVHIPVQVCEECTQVGAIQAAHVDTPVLKSYPNEEDKDGAWIIPIEIYEDNMKHKMMATTNMEWKEFKKQISSDGPAWSQLTCEADFTAAMVCAADKALVAQTWVVIVDIKNKLEKRKLHEIAAKREKPECKDDLPTGVALKMTYQLAQLRQLEAHLYCATHSCPRKKVFCFIERGSNSVKGGHQELSNHEVTLWSKVVPVDCPVMEGNGKPDPSSAKETIKKEELSETSSAPDHQLLRLSTTKEVLALMDSKFPSTEEPFMDSCGNLVAFDIHNALDIYKQETLFLATFGTLGLEEERIIEVENEDEVEEVGDHSSSYVKEIEGLEVGYMMQEV
ncbi:hypothetical protein EI94DRAFT_1702141 [Lactarius quietus]|nr:hypothetical protein EI94DRAFT_1702141 [Lactarius quietus]